MSQISSIYDAVHALVVTALPQALRLPNAYSLIDNPEHLLSTGYAIAVGGAVNDEQSLSGRITLTREVRLILTRRLSALTTDALQKGVAEKLLLEDLTLLIKAFERDPYLNEVSPEICFAKYVSDDGVSLIEETGFLQVSATFNIKYFEK